MLSKEGRGAALIADEVLETIVVATEGSGVTITAGRTLAGGWSGVGNRGIGEDRGAGGDS